MLLENANFYNHDDLLAPLFLCFVCIFIPYAAFRSYLRFKKHKVIGPKEQFQVRSMVWMIGICFLAVVVADRQQINLLGEGVPSARIALVGLVELAVLLFYVRASLPKSSNEHRGLLRLLLPEVKSEMRFWIYISVIAGLCEEVTYRSVVYTLVLRLTGSPGLSLALTSAAFAAAHALYGLRTALFIFLLGVFFQLSVVITGSLYLAIAIHIGYDLGFGIIALRFFQREVVAEPLPSAL
jgi:membrane protease YdiL (CAAX protease family)